MRAILAAFFCAGLVINPAQADPTLFPGSDYGKTTLRLRESLGPNVQIITTMGHIFERIGLLRADDELRVVARPVVRLDRLVEANGQTATSTCTATIVSADLVLTNYHCIPGFDAVEKASILIDYEDEEDPDARRVAIETTPIAADQELDYAFVRMTEPLPAGVEPLTLQAPLVQPGERLTFLHHPAGAPKMMTQYGCKAADATSPRESELRHVCDSLPGSSGGLLVNADLQPVGLHHTGGLRDDDPGSFNLATRMTAIRDALSEINDTAAPVATGTAPAGDTATAATTPQLPPPPAGFGDDASASANASGSANAAPATDGAAPAFATAETPQRPAGPSGPSGPAAPATSGETGSTEETIEDFINSQF